MAHLISEDPNNLKKEEEIINYVLRNSTPGDIPSILSAYDTFGWTKKWFMAVGDKKGDIVDNLISTYKPRVVIEIGGYIGYSAVRFASKVLSLYDRSEVSYTTFEFHPGYAALAQKVIDFAGLQDVCKIVVGKFSDNLKEIKKNSVDMVFIDHLKDLYLPDFRLIEDHGILHSGSVVVADNILYPGSPDYLAYVSVDSTGPNKSPNVAKHYLIHSTLEYSNDVVDAISVSIMK